MGPNVWDGAGSFVHGSHVGNTGPQSSVGVCHQLPRATMGHHTRYSSTEIQERWKGRNQRADNEKSVTKEKFQGGWTAPKLP